MLVADGYGAPHLHAVGRRSGSDHKRRHGALLAAAAAVSAQRARKEGDELAEALR